MKEEGDVFNIFQDPLLTLIALILLGTLWIIIPRGSEPVESIRLSQLQKEVNRLKEEISSLDEMIRELEGEIQAIEVLEKNVTATKKETEQRINQLTQEVAKLKAIIQSKREEIKKLEMALEEAKKRAEEAKLVKELTQRISKLKEEITTKEALLKKLEDDLKKAKETQEEERVKAKGREELLNELKHEISIEREKVKMMEEEKEKYAETLRKRAGIEAYSTDLVENKEQVAFEAVKNRLVLIDENNYDVETFLTTYNNMIVPAVKYTRKSAVRGESISEIAESTSKFQTMLAKLDPEKHYILFGVQKDSFEVFLKARQIAWQKGFVVAWWPREEGPIYAGPGGGKVEGRK